MSLQDRVIVGRRRARSADNGDSIRLSTRATSSRNSVSRLQAQLTHDRPHRLSRRFSGRDGEPLRVVRGVGLI